MTEPSVSVIICTRNRAMQLDTCLRAILSGTWRQIEVIVVDQSCDNSSVQVVETRALEDPRIKLVRDAGRGLSRARNLGIQACSGELIIFTDDDCEPAPDWLATMLGAMLEDSTIGIAFGAVIPVEYDRKRGFIVGHYPNARQRITGRVGKLRDSGIGANMALRRSALECAGGFDEMLGAGGYFPAFEDSDMAYRVLRAGFALLEVPESLVHHNGFRDWAQGRPLIRETYMACGAAWAKHARLGDPVGYLMLLWEVWLAASMLMKAVLRRRGPVGFGRFVALLVGIIRTFELEIDRTSCVYRHR